MKKYGVILLMAICFFSSAAYFMFEVTTFRQYAECFYAFATILINLFNLTIITLKMPQMSKLINDFQRTIQKRKFDQSFKYYYLENKRGKYLLMDTKLQVQKILNPRKSMKNSTTMWRNGLKHSLNWHVLASQFHISCWAFSYIFPRIKVQSPL